jgi:penicillin amidase
MRHSAIAAVVLSVFLGGCATWSYLGYRCCQDYPEDETETLKLSGLSAPVKVYFDDLGVPHVEAHNEPDLVRAVGFLQGRSRFFQMDTIRRYARGRLSELVGEQKLMLGSTVSLDRSMRSWGFDRASQAEVASLDDESRRLMTAYVEGVNAALKEFEPIEYRLLRVDPEPWTIADSFAVGYMVAWGITHNWRHEVCRLLLALHVGWERSERIFPPDPWPGPAAIATGGEAHELPPSVAPELKEMFPERPYRAPQAETPVSAERAAMEMPVFTGASNGWVLGGGRTASGMPMVMGDPHLPHALPSVLFQQHLHTPEQDVIGVTVPGIPYELIGHNQKVAWTFTSAVADVLDLYIEKIDPENPAQVIGPEGPQPIEAETVVVRIRDGSEYIEKKEKIRRTPRGPLLNDMYSDLLPEGAPLVSVHGIPMGAGGSIRSLRRAAGVKTVAELREALEGFSSPINTSLAADVNGAIAIFATGSVPVRENHRGTFAAPAWLEKYRWKEMAKPGDMPFATGGKNDYFAHTNTLMVDPARSPFLFQIDSAPSYRRDRVIELIEATKKHTVESNSEIQGDVMVLRARRVLPKILEDLKGMPEPTPQQQELIQLLQDWDHRATADSTACAVFFATYRETMRRALQDEIDGKGLVYLMSFRYFANAVDLWYDDPNHPVWDDRSTASTETRADVVRAGFKDGIDWLKKTLGEDPRDWQWGELHDLDLKHALGSKVSAFNLERWKAPGASATVWKAHYDMGEEAHPFRYKYGPVLRLVVDLADIQHAWWILDTGSSGWPRSPHYQDQFESWKQVKLAPMISNWEEIKKTAAGVLTLR